MTLLRGIPGSPGLPVLWWAVWLVGGLILFWGLVWVFQRLGTTWEQEIWREHRREHERDSAETEGSGHGRSSEPTPVTPVDQPGPGVSPGGDAASGDR
ncbi:MAG TPA: hypothetical protein VFA45_23210 [Actinomycetes bacterium]|nr:hypothetical protein [Actinomycetes bacterium]